jgi:hypothetical protein
MVFCIGFFRPAQAQYISLQGVNITHVLTDNIVIDFDVSSAIGGDLNYSGYLFRNLNYNLGAAYLSAEDAEIFFLKTGISKIYLVPTSFNKAKNKESVSYITNNWLGSLDLNCYNGLLLQGTEVLYVFAAEPAWNLAYMLGKKKRFFIGGVFALRYTLYPGGAYAALSQVGIPVQLGVKYEL